MNETEQSIQEPSALQIFIEQQAYVAQGLITYEETTRQFEENCAAQWHAAQQVVQ